MYVQLFILLFLHITTCYALSFADSVPFNPGINETLLNPTGIYTPANYSELVTVYSMGTLPLPPWQRNNCPQFISGLVEFTNYQYGMNWTIHENEKYIIMADILPDNITLNMIVIYGILIFDDQDINLSVAEIRVEEGGSLIIGMEECRLYSNINITFTGSADSSTTTFWDTETNKTSKGIQSKGNVDIHGKQYHPTWTRLSRSALAGDVVIYLQDVINWEVNQLILIATSAWFDCPPELQETYCQSRPQQNEVRQIIGIQQTSQGEQALLLNEPLVYSHYSGPEYQVEIGLLSRRINLIGEMSYNSDGSYDYFGGHVLIAFNGSGRFSGVRGDNMGQLNVLGRYPFHYHLLSNGNTSIIEDCVVTNSNFRAYVIHNSNSTLLASNIAYNITGHAYYLESGTEENNVLIYNLAVHIKPIGFPAQGGWDGTYFTYVANNTFINPSDVSASGFYILDAYNIFVGNVAVGGSSGFIFINAPLPVFLPFSLNNGWNNPQNRPTLLFMGNSAHSTGFYWPEQGPAIYVGGQLWVDVNGSLNYNPGRYSRNTLYSNGDDAYMYFDDSKLFLTAKGILHWGSRSKIFNLEVQDMGFAGIFTFGRAGLNNALISGFTDNQFNDYYVPALATSNFRTAIQFYDTFSLLIISNVTFRNFDCHCVYRHDKKCSCDIIVSFLDSSDQYLPQGISASQGIQFVNISEGVYYVDIQNYGNSSTRQSYCGYAGSRYPPSESSLLQNIQDYDGTLSSYGHTEEKSSYGHPKIIGGFGRLWDQGRDCKYNATAHIHICDWNINRGVGYMVSGYSNLTDDVVDFAEARRRGELVQRVATLAPAKRILHDYDLDLDALAGGWIATRHAQGGIVALHCVTAMQLIVSIGALQAAGSVPGANWIEHAVVVPADCLADLAALGVTVVTQPNFVAERGEQYLTDVPTTQERDQLWRVASLCGARVPVALSTDLPLGDADPLGGHAGPQCTGPPWAAGFWGAMNASMRQRH